MRTILASYEHDAVRRVKAQHVTSGGVPRAEMVCHGGGAAAPDENTAVLPGAMAKPPLAPLLPLLVSDTMQSKTPPQQRKLKAEARLTPERATSFRLAPLVRTSIAGPACGRSPLAATGSPATVIATGMGSVFSPLSVGPQGEPRNCTPDRVAPNAAATPSTVVARRSAAPPRAAATAATTATATAAAAAAAPHTAAWGWGGGGAKRGAALLGGWSAEQQEWQERKLCPRLPVRARTTRNPLSASFSLTAVVAAPLHVESQACGAMECTLKRTRAPGDVGDARPPRAPRLQPIFNDALHVPAFALDTCKVTSHDSNPSASAAAAAAAAADRRRCRCRCRRRSGRLTARVAPRVSRSLRSARRSAHPKTSLASWRTRARSQGAPT